MMPPSSLRKMTRRDFLNLTWKGLLGLCGLWGLSALLRYLSYLPDPAPPSRYDLGLESDFPRLEYTLVSQVQAVVFYTPEGWKALSLVCPHLGCLVEMDDNGFTCPCHGSQFTPQGKLRHSPAQRDLDELKVEITPDGHMLLYQAGPNQ